jgi:Fe-S-cluster-containing dehydrogenase component
MSDTPSPESPVTDPVPDPAPAAGAAPQAAVAAGAAPVREAPADAALVPLEELAPAITAASTSRRAFLGFGLALAGGVAGAAVLAKFTPVFAEEPSDASPIVSTYDPTTRQWAYVVDTAACIGCGLCVAACKEENHVPEEPEYTRTWIERHVTTSDGDVHVDSPEGGIHGFPFDSTAPTAAGKTVDSAFFMPRLCMQCANSPCTSVCPVGATYRTVDGVILVDARRCIGCGYCVVACPYGARYLVPAGEHAPNDTPGIADKCTWCYHRISRNLKPACVEVCPVGARKFGDLNDPDDEITTIVREQDPQPYWPEYGTQPRVLYLGPVTEEA